MQRQLQIFLMLVFVSTSAYSENLSLHEAVSRAIRNNPGLSSQMAKVESEDSLVSSQYALSSPMVGLTELKRGNSTTYGTVMQKVEFPTKYFLRAAKQRRKAAAEEQVYAQKKLELRASVISTYYALYAVQHIIELTQQDLQRLKEVSRIAESKYASGKAPQHDSMKAHVAQTQTESTLIGLRQEEEALQSKLAFLLNEAPGFRTETDKKLAVPDVSTQLASITLSAISASPKVKEKQKRLETANYEKRLQKWSFAPDFQIRYQQRLSGAPADSHIIGVELSIPVWFWGNSSKASSASYREVAAKRALAYKTQEVSSDIRILKSQITSEYELFKIFDTSLIPQALTSYNSATSAYRANKISFVDYLDTERALLRVEIARYRTLAKYIQSLTQFEALLGTTISNLGHKSSEEKQDEKS